MKNVKELKKSVAPRLVCSWGENCAIFFITIGGIAATVLAWSMTVDFLEAVGFVNDTRDLFDTYDIAAIGVTLGILLLVWIIATPFFYGVKWYRIQQIRGNSVHAKSIFSCYTSLKKSLQVYKLSILVGLKRMYVIIPFAMVIGIGLYMANEIEKMDGGIFTSIAVTCLLLFTGLAFCVYLIFNIRYAAVPYLYALGHDTPSAELIKNSERIMKGKGEYVKETVFSLAGWLASCLFVFPMVFAVPYMNMVYTAAINEIIVNDDAEENERGEMLTV